MDKTEKEVEKSSREFRRREGTEREEKSVGTRQQQMRSRGDKHREADQRETRTKKKRLTQDSAGTRNKFS